MSGVTQIHLEKNGVGVTTTLSPKANASVFPTYELGGGITQSLQFTSAKNGVQVTSTNKPLTLTVPFQIHSHPPTSETHNNREFHPQKYNILKSPNNLTSNLTKSSC